MAKSWFARGVLLVFLANFAGCYIFFSFELFRIRYDMREQIAAMPDSSLTKFIFSPEEFRSVRVDDHEIKVSGKMYDIARIHTYPDSVIVFALHDEAEDQLLVFLDKIISRSGQENPLPHSLANFITLQYILVDHHWSAFPFFEIILQDTPYRWHFSSFHSNNVTPPPEC